MKHHLVKQLKAENKDLKAEVRMLKRQKPEYSNSMAELIDRSTNTEALAKHFQRNKYAK